MLSVSAMDVVDGTIVESGLTVSPTCEATACPPSCFAVVNLRRCDRRCDRSTTTLTPAHSEALVTTDHGEKLLLPQSTASWRTSGTLPTPARRLWRCRTTPGCGLCTRHASAEVVESLVAECPAALAEADNSGKFPLHHATAPNRYVRPAHERTTKASSRSITLRRAAGALGHAHEL
jgi:hypothetical protein